MASTSIQTMSSSSTSSSKPLSEYDVFLSFRGEDTRHKFTDHLYHALNFNRINTFKDDRELEIGKPISQELLDAIEKSRIVVIIFSENYGSFTWCLEELAKIVECRERGILTVLPIFYHVEPTDVRHQRKTFEAAFSKHEERFQENPEVVEKWRVTLREVTKIAGKHLGEG